MASEDEQSTIRSVANKFFDAIEAGDVNTMYDTFAANAEIWHNYDEQVVSRDTTKTVLTGMVSQIDNIRYTNRRLIVFPGGFCQQHALEGNRKHDDVKVRLPAAVICRVQKEKIVRLDEYFDSAHSATFRKYAPMRL